MNRFYRFWCDSKDLFQFNVAVKESDLFILADKNLKMKAFKILKKYRTIIENYILRNPEFKTALSPLEYNETQPCIIKEMIKESKKVDVGPMASVAGAIAEFVGKDLLEYSKEVIVENGGDIFMKIIKPRNVCIYAGEKFKKNIIIEIQPEKTPLGIATSSSKIGESLSFGKADAVAVLSKSAILADAAATKLCNMIKSDTDVTKAIEYAGNIKEIKGVVVVKDDKLWLWGDVKLADKPHN